MSNHLWCKFRRWVRELAQMHLNTFAQRSPTNRVASVVAIEVGVFTLQNREYSDDEMFEHLQRLKDQISQNAIRQNGKMIYNDSDRILVVFDGEKTSQTIQALKFCVELQSKMYVKILADHAAKHPIFTLKIGIDTGRLLTDQRSQNNDADNFFGQTISIARQLASVCDINSVLVSAETAANIDQDPLGQWPSSRRCRLVQFQNDSALHEVYECDPLERHLKHHNESLAHFRQIVGQIRQSPRLVPDPTTNLAVQCDLGPTLLANVAVGGVALILPTRLKAGTKIKIHIDSANAEFREKLRAGYISELELEVRWSRSEGQTYFHGLSFRPASELDGAYLFKEIQKLSDRVGVSIRLADKHAAA